ncbi:hypothetical protein ANO11243_063050 [Dothideomycetidae sp. 11243]|nr:hypothetical protein ANO11243_063050 [fungal sp. No.11243]
MAAMTPRKPLGELHANTLISPLKVSPTPKHASTIPDKTPAQPKSLKRSVSILDQDKGFQYLKRRKLSPIRATVSSTIEQPPAKASYHHAPPPRPGSSNSSSSEDGDSAKSRQSSHSFTSLINYDPSSQANGPTPRSIPPHYARRLLSSQPQRQSQDRTHIDAARLRAAAVAGRAVAASRTEALKIRLRIALYKVVTGQCHVPFPKLGVFRAKVPGIERRWTHSDSPATGVVPEKSGGGGKKSADEIFGPPIDAVRSRARREDTDEETIVAGDASDVV